MTKHFFCLFFVVACATSVFAQTKYYQEYGKSRLLSELDFAKKGDLLRLKYEKISLTAKVDFKIVEEKVKNDSILVVYQIFVTLSEGMTMNLSANKERIYELIGKPFPNFELNDINGNLRKFEVLKGKPMVLNFWFNGCKPCKKEMPVLNRIMDEYKQQVTFISITFNTVEEVRRILEVNEFKFDHLVNAKWLIDKIGVTGYPKTLVVDKNGYVRQIFECVDSIVDESGEVVLGNGDEIKKEIEKIL